MRPKSQPRPALYLSTLAAVDYYYQEHHDEGLQHKYHAERVGVLLAILVSLLFGASHLLTWTYGIIAAIISVYLGFLYYFTGNPFAPMVTHAVYDYVALVWLLKVPRSN
jgi:membrane protease YdiL (CAAX protease family)